MLAERLTAQLLAGPPASDATAVAERLLAVQGQDRRGFRLAVRARTRGLRAADVDRALSEERSLVVTWLNRGTLHLVRAEDYPWLHALTAPTQFNVVMSRLGRLGVPPDDAQRGVAAVEAALEDGPLRRAQLREAIAAAGVETEGQALPHVLMLASLRGVAVRGPVVEREEAFVLLRDWLGAPAPVDREAALGELALRYLAGHGPASDRDLARWAGLGLRDVRAGLARVADRLADRGDGLVDLARRPPPAELPPPRLLGAFDPVLLGWTSRKPIVGRHEARVVAQAMFRPFALVDGRAVATWRLDARRGVELEPFARLSRADAAALRDDAEDVVRFLDAAPPATEWT